MLNTAVSDPTLARVSCVLMVLFMVALGLLIAYEDSHE